MRGVKCAMTATFISFKAFLVRVVFLYFSFHSWRRFRARCTIERTANVIDKFVCGLAEFAVWTIGLCDVCGALQLWKCENVRSKSYSGRWTFSFFECVNMRVQRRGEVEWKCWNARVFYCFPSHFSFRSFRISFCSAIHHPIAISYKFYNEQPRV